MPFTPCNYRIAATEEGLERGYFHLMGIPIDVKTQYKDYTIKSPQGSGWVAKHGYKNVELNWESLNPRQLNVLRSRVESALNSADRLLYMTIPRNDGTSPSMDDWIDISGKPDLRDPTVLDGRTSGVHLTNISLFLNDVEIVNDPATF